MARPEVHDRYSRRSSGVSDPPYQSRCRTALIYQSSDARLVEVRGRGQLQHSRLSVAQHEAFGLGSSTAHAPLRIRPRVAESGMRAEPAHRQCRDRPDQPFYARHAEASSLRSTNRSEFIGDANRKIVGITNYIAHQLCGGIHAGRRLSFDHPTPRYESCDLPPLSRKARGRHRRRSRRAPIRAFVLAHPVYTIADEKIFSMTSRHRQGQSAGRRQTRLFRCPRHSLRHDGRPSGIADRHRCCAGSRRCRRRDRGCGHESRHVLVDRAAPAVRP